VPDVSRRGWLLFVALGVIWGLPYLLIRISVREVSPGTLVFLRTAPVALVLVPMVVRRGETRALLRRWREILVYCAVELTIPWYFVSSGEQRLSSSLTGLLIAIVPLIGVFLARLGGDEERLDRRQLVGLAVGLAGVALLVGVDVRGATALPIAEVLLATVGYALGPRLYAHTLGGLSDLGVVAASMVVTAVAWAPVAFTHLPAHLSVEVTSSVVLLAVGPTFLGFLVFFALISEIGPTRATIVTYVNPAVALLLGVAVLGEAVTVGVAVGFPLVIVGSILATRRRRPLADLEPTAS